MEGYTLEQIISLLEAELNKNYEEYLTYHRELKPYTERQLEEGEVAEANKILANIQNKFKELYPVYHWITFRFEYATNVIKSYNEFIDRLKANGAKSNDEANDPAFTPVD